GNGRNASSRLFVSRRQTETAGATFSRHAVTTASRVPEGSKAAAAAAASPTGSSDRTSPDSARTTRTNRRALGPSTPGDARRCPGRQRPGAGQVPDGVAAVVGDGVDAPFAEGEGAHPGEMVEPAVEALAGQHVPEDQRLVAHPQTDDAAVGAEADPPLETLG